jgi:hypothetical protein
VDNFCDSPPFDLVFMPTKLANLRSRLSRLQRQRAAVRWGSAVCAPVAVALWLLVAAFVCDWSLNLPVALRAVMLLAWFAGTAWAIQTFAWPLLRVRESELDVALVVEKQHRIDNDLVAALQFEQPAAKTWGSTRLTDAVVDYVAEFSPSLNVFEGFSYRPLPRRAAALGATLLIVVGSAMAFPGHASAFWNRFVLGSSHYPTRTRIESIMVGGQLVPVFSRGSVPQIRIPYGQAITVAVTCAGEVPSSGVVMLSGVHSNSSNKVDLQPVLDQPGTFDCQVAHMADSFFARVQAGDATSDPIEIVIVPLPLVDLTWEVTPPKYACASLKPHESDGGSRQLAVLEGSTAKLNLICSNKLLKSARLTAAGKVIELQATSREQTGLVTWMLPEGTLFQSIHEALKYEIQVVDEDGLSLELPIAGQIRLKLDRVPRIVASAVTRQVLPTAQPKIDYAAGDDFGVAKIVAVIQISREDGRTSRHELVARTVAEQDQPLTTFRDQIAIPLSPYELTKGDEVKVVLEVTDWRGDVVGHTSLGEPNAFIVTDLNGIFAQTGEEDKKTAKQLDEILRRELGLVGEKK